MDANAGMRRAGRWLVLAALLLAGFTAAAHDTIVPHHLEDVKDLAHARDVRGLALVITIAFTVVLATVIFLAMRYAPEDEDPADLREEQERLRHALLAAAEAVKGLFGAADGELASAFVAAYGRAAGVAVSQDPMTVLGVGSQFGADTLTARRMDAAGRIELSATTATAGATVRIALDGSYSVTVFAVTTQFSTAEEHER